MIADKYDAMCKLMTSALEVSGCFLMVFDDPKLGPQIGADLPPTIYSAMPGHLSVIIEEIERRQHGFQLTPANMTELGQGWRVLKNPGGRAVALIDGRKGAMMEIPNDIAARFFDWAKDNLPDPELPQLTQDIIEQAKQCGCGICDACKAVAAAARSPGDVSDG